MLELKTTFLCALEVELNLGTIVGDTPLGRRVIVDVGGGRMTGPRVSGRVLASGGDWLLVGTDGCARIDVRASIELDDGSVTYVTYGGRLNVPLEVAHTAFDRETAETVDPSGYYFRTAPTFETASRTYAWLNHIQAIGVGRLTREGVAYTLYEVL